MKRHGARAGERGVDLERDPLRTNIEAPHPLVMYRMQQGAGAKLEKRT